MAGDDDDGRYARPRVVVAGVLTLLLIALMLLDADRPDYELGEVTVATMLAAILTLLGIEMVDALRGGGRR